MADHTHFIDGQPIPDGYLSDVSLMVNVICDIEDLIPDWELEAYNQERNRDGE